MAGKRAPRGTPAGLLSTLRAVEEGTPVGAETRSALRDGKVSIRHAVLGFLMLEPQSGYDLKRSFDQTIGYTWNAYDSQIYTELRRLEAEGYVEGTETGGGRRRRPYSLTKKGQEEFDAWLASPSQRSFNRDEFLLRLFFFHRLDPVEQVNQIRAEVARLTHDVEMARRVLGPFEERSAATRADHPLHWQLAAAHVSDSMTRTRLAELQRLLAEVEGTSRREPNTAGSGRARQRRASATH